MSTHSNAKFCVKRLRLGGGVIFLPFKEDNRGVFFQKGSWATNWRPLGQAWCARRFKAGANNANPPWGPSSPPIACVCVLPSVLVAPIPSHCLPVGLCPGIIARRGQCEFWALPLGHGKARLAQPHLVPWPSLWPKQCVPSFCCAFYQKIARNFWDTRQGAADWTRGWAKWRAQNVFVGPSLFGGETRWELSWPGLVEGRAERWSTTQ